MGGWVGAGGEGGNLRSMARAWQIRMTVLHEWEVVRVTVYAWRHMCKKSGRKIWIGCNGFFGNGVVVIITHNKHSALVIPCHIIGMLVTEMLSAWVNG